MDVSNGFKELIGHKVRFKTYDGEYEGIIKTISFDTKEVTVEHVYGLPQNVYMGNLNFFFYEFLTYSIFNKLNKIPEGRKNEQSSASNMRYSENNCCTNMVFKNLSTKLKSEQFVVDEDQNFNEFVLKLPPNLRKLLPNYFVTLDSIDLEFKSAIKHISLQSVIGVSFKGCNISRKRKFDWIGISTDYCVFLFNIQTIGRDAFNNGLKDIFQSQNIVKVIHGCQQPSDCLFHIFSTTLRNVFDTQVADFIVNKRRCSDKSKFEHVSSLDKCLVNYMAVPNEFLYENKKLCSGAGNYFISEQSADNEDLNILIKNTVYLILLREKLTKLMLAPVYEASNMHLKVLSESSLDLTLEPSDGTAISPCLLAEGLRVVAFRSNSFRKSACPIPPKLKSQNKNAGGHSSPTKTATKKFDYCLNKSNITLPNKNFIQKSKLESKTKQYALITDSQNGLDFANDFKQKCSATDKKLKNDSKIQNDDFKKPSKYVSYSKKTRDLDATPPKPSASKFDTNMGHLKSNIKDTALMNITEVEYGACSKSDSTYESKVLNKSFSNNVRNNSISDHSEIWAKLRLAFGVSPDASNTSVNNSKEKFKFVPSGMGC